jgi:hexosaminidase
MTTETLVPRPLRLQRGAGELVLDSSSTIAAAGEAREVASLWRQLVGPATGFDFPFADGAATLRLVIDRSAGPGSEAYRLSVRPEGVALVAPAKSGLINGLQTLRQLFAPEIFQRAAIAGARWTLPLVEIEDAPRFSWRGGHLDVSRHFMPLAFLYRFVDLLAMHKLNVFHLHLTDDQGWRFPSSKYPLLTSIGGWRSETLVGHSRHQEGAGRFDGTPHGGFYSARQLSDLVGYAADRNVTVVPEIDLPGHVQSALAAYPELGNNPDAALEVWTRWGIDEHVLSLSGPSVEFATTVISELMEIFPSPFIHVGGDECPRTEWRRSAAAQARIAELGLSGEDALQNWLLGQLNQVVRSGGRRLVGWDEILEGGPLPDQAVVMSWRGLQGGITAASKGFDVVMCPEQPCYFDHYQSPAQDEPLAHSGLITVEDVYNYDPLPADLDRSAAEHVLGTQFLLWSEYLAGPSEAEYMGFPRAAAMAEVAWSEPGNPYSEFLVRLQGHIPRLDALGVNYRPLEGSLPWQRGGTGPRRRPIPVD